jgi:hypothetical protein
MKVPPPSARRSPRARAAPACRLGHGEATTEGPSDQRRHTGAQPMREQATACARCDSGREIVVVSNGHFGEMLADGFDGCSRNGAVIVEFVEGVDERVGGYVKGLVVEDVDAMLDGEAKRVGQLGSPPLLFEALSSAFTSSRASLRRARSTLCPVSSRCVVVGSLALPSCWSMTASWSPMSTSCVWRSRRR